MSRSVKALILFKWRYVFDEKEFLFMYGLLMRIIVKFLMKEDRNNGF